MKKMYRHRCRRCRKVYEHRAKQHEFCSYLCYAIFAKKHGWWSRSTATPEAVAEEVQRVNRAVQKLARLHREGKG